MRGTGRAGIDACTDGNDCETALCLEGASNALVCSQPCQTAAECPASLPRCLDVPFVGRICARDPASAGDAGATDAAVIDGCTGACATTTLNASIGGHTGAFDRAQHGTSGTDGIYVEAHFGGDPACPTQTSPTPARTLVVNGLRSAAAGTVLTEADGVTASLLDFDGSLTSAPIDRATAVRATARYVARGAYVSFDLVATFPDGTISGGFFAPHCASLDGQ